MMSKSKTSKITKGIMFGVFDGLHDGHLNMIDQAYEIADKIVVVLATDENCIKAKGQAPKLTAEKRRKAIKPYVDKAIIGHPSDFLFYLVKEKPDIIFLGYDQSAHIDIVGKYLKDNDGTILRLSSYKPEVNKSHILNKR